jgi:two-component system, NtrC family, sensor kinase
MRAVAGSREEFRALLNRLLALASRGVSYVEFLNELAGMLLEFSGCDALEIRLGEGARGQRCQAARDPEHGLRFAMLPALDGEELVPPPVDAHLFERLCACILERRVDPAQPYFTNRGGFWTAGGEGFVPVGPPVQGPPSLKFGGDLRSFAMIVLPLGASQRGLLLLWSRQAGWFSRDSVEFYESFAESLGDALTHQKSAWALRERVKELTCLYGIAQVVEEIDRPLPQVASRIAELLPPGWQYPEQCAARVLLDGQSHATSGFADGVQRQSAEIIVDDQVRGSVDVVYTVEKPSLDEGPFLKEERSLINEVARQIALFMERRQAEEENVSLQEQLRHADRLATIGQLAAGAAHELNEPLGSVLGYAQLAQKATALPEAAREDLAAIVKAALHAREIVKKLMLFGRQTPPRKTEVDLNAIVNDGLTFIEARCTSEGIALERRLAPSLPRIHADVGQLHQVLINLTVNAVQAMPKGGRLVIATRADKDDIVLSVEDTGTGMTDEVKRHIFMPFFTTKDVGQGTGLGLSVVHGIVTAHGGTIRVQSQVGVGSKFEVRLPRSGAPEARE